MSYYTRSGSKGSVAYTEHDEHPSMDLRDYNEKSSLLNQNSTSSVRDLKNPGIGYRHLLVILGCLGFSSQYAMRVDLSIAIVTMVNQTWIESKTSKPAVNSSAFRDQCPARSPSSTTTADEGPFLWDADTQGLILSAFFYGYILTQVLGAYMSQRWSGKYVYVSGLMMCGLMTLLIPVASTMGPNYLIVVRVLQGIGEGVTKPAIYVMISKWSHRYERSTFGSIVISGCELGTIIGQPLSGILCAYGPVGGWPSVFYVFGTFGCIISILFAILVGDTPVNDKRLRYEERLWLGAEFRDSSSNKNTPLKAILTSVPCYAIYMGHTAKNWGYYTLLTIMPTYFKQVLQFDIRSNGMLSALPYLAMWFVEVIAGNLADVIRSKKPCNIHTTGVRKIFTFLGLFLPGIFLVAEGFVGCDATLAVALLIISMGFVGFVTAGCMVNHLDVAPAYAGTLMGISNTFATIPGMVSPSLTSAITRENPGSPTSWRYVFLIAAGIYTLGSLVYVCFGTGNEQEWGKDEAEDEEDLLYGDLKKMRRHRRSTLSILAD